MGKIAVTSEKTDLVTFGSGLEMGKRDAQGNYEGLEAHMDLVAFFYNLENHHDKERVNRMKQIAELLSDLGQHITPETGQTLTQLRTALDKYRWAIQVSPTAQGFTEILRVPAGLDDGDRWEHRAVRQLLDLLQMGMFRIRRCEDPACRQWFYLRGRLDQKYHHPNCKQRHYDEKKRAHMRESAEEKRGRAKPRSAVGTAPGKRRKQAEVPRKRSS